MNRFEHKMRWYGPEDSVTLSDIKQSGSSGVVTALHHIPNGEVWPVDEIIKRKKLIEAADLKWSVVESIPVHEDIKRGSGDYVGYIEKYQQSIMNLSQCGVKVVTYNFMPVLDWSRTHLAYQLPDGSTALYFEKAAFAAFDLFILKRPKASTDYTSEEYDHARERFSKMSHEDTIQLTHNIIAGLPGGTTEGITDLDRLQGVLDTYRDIGSETLRKNLSFFLNQVIPVAELHDVKMAIHPDDPPFSLLGLPRVVSNADDINYILSQVKSNFNGLCFCTGSFGVNPTNDLIQMIKDYGDHIHFVHLRATQRDEQGNFIEANHLEGDVDMVGIIEKLLIVANKNGVDIPMRPDHGHKMLSDLEKEMNPGYSLLGRMKGLAELRGVEMALLSRIPALVSQ